mgnify:CR=1 FL=1
MKQLALILFLIAFALPLHGQTTPGDDATTAPAAQKQLVDSFLYIEDLQVRHEMLFPLPVLESVLPLTRAEGGRITVAEQRAAKPEIAAFLSAVNPLTIDGIEVRPEGSRIVFFDNNIQNIVGDVPERDLEVRRAIVGVILNYSTKGAPSEVGMTWGVFSGQMQTVRATVYYGDHAERKKLYSGDESITWRSPGAQPLPSIEQVSVPEKRGLFRKRPEISDSTAEQVFRTLHKNVYRAFDYRTESAIYDALAHSVAGELLAQLYLDIRRGVEIENEGGARTRIREVEIVDGAVLPARDEEYGFRYDCRWTVTGTVEHWGHIHSRKNLYQATFEIGVRDEAWKITEVSVTNQERLETITGLRRDDLGGGE